MPMLIKLTEAQQALVLQGLSQLWATPGLPVATQNEIAELERGLKAELVVDEKALGEIEAQWFGRCKNFGYTPESQADFFSGAMAARVAAGMEHANAMPPRWVTAIMRGDQISG
jgi:hypothetical protein